MPIDENLKVLAINSFAVHGTASLKAVMQVLGSRVLPVPSVLLNGLTNMPGVVKFPSPFKELLVGAFELAIHRKQKLILYAGYLGHSGQIDMIIECISTYKEHIKYVIADPICGDHGRSYVSDEIIAEWPDLIEKSNIAFPNLTELKLLTGHQPEEEKVHSYYVDQFLRRFTKVDLVVTSAKNEELEIGVELYCNAKAFSFFHPLLSKNFGGSGDIFVSLFILHHFYKNYSKEDALKQSAILTAQIIEKSIASNADELVLN